MNTRMHARLTYARRIEMVHQMVFRGELEPGGCRAWGELPYLAAVLASLKEQRRRDLWTVWLSIGAIVVAV